MTYLGDPDGTADELYDGYCEDDADDDGAVASPAGGIPPFRIAFPGETVEAECRAMSSHVAMRILIRRKQ